MPAKPVKIGERMFARQTDALEFFRVMLNSYRRGERVSDSDAVELNALLLRHINVEEKTGVGIDHFLVDSDDYGGQCFWVVRADSTRVQFTYRRCVTGIW
ncbi:DCL family protein [Stenotrophomonas sp. S48]|uniref:DCL family protein n=1 Tax=unclassified Stenotrophomonas TaxID=196198 RepID=UPI00190151E2|nr:MULTISPECIES: DCL family protein [unclassified Stenotrophomonas]MBK0024996.1 DCL family protein [Stenotrophomonas sp. S48]MBK0046700.1 DCL family protein [Stenotrophomonas sp. S49]